MRMKRRILAALLGIMPLYGYAATHVTEESGATLSVTGEVYRLCTVSMPDEGAFPLGEFSVHDWVENQSWLRHGAPPEFTFTLTGCGEGRVTLSVTGTSVNSSNRIHWLANQTGSTSELAASLELVKTDGTTTPLSLNGTAYPYADTRDNETVLITLKGLLNRTDNSHRPTGTYQATLTVNFDFT